MLELKIGEKIRVLRKERNITQKELVGDQITRNMLSLIENGTASPSVATLLYLAEKLDVPVGYFFSSNNEDESIYSKLKIIGELKSAYAAKDYSECVNLCENLPESTIDDEVAFILASACIFEAKKFAEELKIKSALESLSMTEKYAAMSLYCGEDFTNAALYYRELIRSAVTEDVPESLCLTNAVCGFVPLELCMYFHSLKLAQSDANLLKVTYNFPEKSYHARHIAALSMIKEGKITDAQKKLRELSLDPALPYYMRYRVLYGLENTANELGDLRLAYSSSRRRLELIEKFKIR